MFTIPAYKTSFPSAYSINTTYICKNHSVVYKNHTVISTNHTVVYRILRRIFELFKLTITKKATGSFRSNRSLIFYKKSDRIIQIQSLTYLLLFSELFNNHNPSVWIRFVAILYSTKFVIQFLAYRTWLAVLGNDVRFIVFKVVYAFDWANYGCSTASSGFLECFKLFFRNRTAFNFQSHVFSQLHKASVSYGRKDGRRKRSYVCIVLDTEEIGSTALVDILLFLCIEIELAGITCIVSHLVCTETCRIVTSDLESTGTKRCRTVKLTDYNVRIGSETAFEIWTYRSNKHHAPVPISSGRM